MPPPDEAVLGRRKAVIAALRAIVPGEGVIEDGDALRAYESDALTAYRQRPLRRSCLRPPPGQRIPALVPRPGRQGGAARIGHSLSGGALPWPTRC